LRTCKQKKKNFFLTVIICLCVNIYNFTEDDPIRVESALIVLAMY